MRTNKPSLVRAAYITGYGTRVRKISTNSIWKRKRQRRRLVTGQGENNFYIRSFNFWRDLEQVDLSIPVLVRIFGDSLVEPLKRFSG